MQQKNATKKPGKKGKTLIKPVKKPYLTGPVLSGRTVKSSFKLLAYEILFIFLNLLLGAALTFEGSAVLRIITNGLLVAACAGLVYMDGTRAGESDVSYGEIAYGRKEAGKNVDQKDIERCYHPAKGFVSVLVGTLPLLIIAVIYAFSAEKQVYSLQALPGWVSAFSVQQDIALPLQYYNQPYTMTVIDVFRIIIRACIYPFVNMAGVDNANGVLLVDRLSPLLILLPFLFYGVGYLRGPGIRAIVHGSIASNAKRHIRKEKRERRARQQNKPDQLI